jgi:hypothetical protein
MPDGLDIDTANRLMHLPARAKGSQIPSVGTLERQVSMKSQAGLPTRVARLADGRTPPRLGRAARTVSGADSDGATPRLAAARRRGRSLLPGVPSNSLTRYSPGLRRTYDGEGKGLRSQPTMADFTFDDAALGADMRP